MILPPWMQALAAQLHRTVDPEGALQRLRERLNERTGRSTSTPTAPPETFAGAGYPAPEQLVLVRSQN